MQGQPSALNHQLVLRCGMHTPRNSSVFCCHRSIATLCRLFVLSCCFVLCLFNQAFMQEAVQFLNCVLHFTDIVCSCLASLTAAPCSPATLLHAATHLPVVQQYVALMFSRILSRHFSSLQQPSCRVMFAALPNSSNESKRFCTRGYYLAMFCHRASAYC